MEQGRQSRITKAARIIIGIITPPVQMTTIKALEVKQTHGVARFGVHLV
jgi:hypothetical protein